MRRGTTRAAFVALLFATIMFSAAGTPSSPQAAAATAPAAKIGSCSAGVNSAPAQPRQVDLVLDDSGSMFVGSSGEPLDRWSNAKYSLEVFASMLGDHDTLNVFRMSDFAGGAAAGPAVVIAGDEPASQRVAKIHQMPMQGGGTPYAPVRAAMADLAGSSVLDKWLVVLSDGEFNDRTTADVQADLTAFVAANSTESKGARVAFLAIGADAPRLTDNPGGGIFYQQAAQTSDLLGMMTSFSNRIFARSTLTQTAPGKAAPDVDLDQLMVFAQGGDVKLTSLTAGGTELEPVSQIEVSWASNPDVRLSGRMYPAEPNKGLHGLLATYKAVPAGSIVAGVDGAQTVDMFYIPRASFGIELRNADGEVVDKGKIVGGKYTVDFGFMDRKCEFIHSDLFGDVLYSAQVVQNGKVTAEAFAPGDVLSLERGDVEFRVGATYLGGNTSEATIDLTVLRPAKPTAFEVKQKTFQLSRLAEYRMPADAMTLHYAIKEDGKLTDFSADEWASFTPDAFTVTTPIKGISFDVALGKTPGEVHLLPRAPGGEPLDAATGMIPVAVHASHVYDEQLNEASFKTTVTIDDDVPLWQHLLHWLLTEGWKLLLLLALAVWMLGYFVRPTFSRRIKARPTITYKPKQRGKRSQVNGKFEKNRLGALIPYRARTATLVYAQRGFAAMKLKARRGGRIEIQNWKQIAQRGNVRINGEELNKETTKPPTLRPASSITAIGADGSYDMTLNA